MDSTIRRETASSNFWSASAPVQCEHSFDRTNYFATIGRESLDGYVAIEADRMRHLWLHEADRQSEMTVVRNEYERGKNDPDNVLMEEVTAAAYEALPYHHPGRSAGRATSNMCPRPS